LEVNLISFIPLISSQENIYTTEASLKYFIIQALASSTLLFLVMIKALSRQNIPLNGEMYEYAIMVPLLLKIGAAPTHWWFPRVMEGLRWTNCLLIITVQKAAPIILISYLIKMNVLTSSFILASVIVGALGGINQTSLRKILTYSSINHTGWMLAASTGGDNLWVLYFIIYSLLTSTVTTITKSFNISFINQVITANRKTTIRFILFTALLSLGGLPPFIGFLPKWIVIQTIITNNLITFIMTTIVVISLVTLYYYLRMCYSRFIILHREVKWRFWSSQGNKIIVYGIILSSISILGLTVCTMITNIR
jgi:NADH-ubiquinone oxidoreductase chain 2